MNKKKREDITAQEYSTLLEWAKGFWRANIHMLLHSAPQDLGFLFLRWSHLNSCCLGSLMLLAALSHMNNNKWRNTITSGPSIVRAHFSPKI